MSLQNLKQRFARIQPTQWTWIVACILAGFIAYYRDSTSEDGAKGLREPEDVETAATLIPAGFVLVPIEVANYESLDSILGKFGVVDLYIPSEDPKKRGRRVAERLRILRAPLNPSRFAVLAREEDSSKLVSHEGAYIVVVKNPNHLGTGIVNQTEDASENGKTKRRRSRITVEVPNDERS